MAFIGILLIYCMFVGIVLLAAAVIFGFIFGAILTAIISTILFIVLTKKGFFQKYGNSENKVVKYSSILFKVLLILTMILSYILTIVIIVFFNS